MRMRLGKELSGVLPPCRAFTLNELLLVFAIVALWAAMLLPVLAKAKQRTLASNCLSNLKQIGVSLQFYIDDNEDRLPGPLETGSRAGYDESSNDELIYDITRDLGDPSPSRKTVLSKTFICPAHFQRPISKATSLMGRKIFLLNDRNVDPSPLGRLPPFGDTASGGDAFPPLKISRFDGRSSREPFVRRLRPRPSNAKLKSISEMAGRPAKQTGSRRGA